MTKRDHKRKARPIGPATVTVTPDAITVVVPDVLGKNESHHGGRFLSPATKAYREAVRLAVARGLVGKGWSIPYGGAFARSGAWRLEVLAVWPRQRSTIKGKPIDFGTAPMGDTDAAIAQSLDALQHAGILDDDARVVEVRAWAMWRQNVRATIIRLVRVENRGRYLADAAQHLIDLALDVPEQEPPPPTLFTKTARKPRRKAATT